MAAQPSEEVDDLEKELNSPNFDEFDSEAWDKRMSKVNKASSVLGTYLLQGWTMLGDHCEKCGSPLMGLRGAEPKCVVCTEANANANENENETQAQTQTQTQTMSKMNGQTQERTQIQRQSSKQVSFGNGVSSNLKLNERGNSNKNNTNNKANNAEEGNNLSIRYENIRTFGDILNKTSSSPLSGKNGASGYEEDIEDNITETQDIVDTTERKDNENVNKSGLKRRLQGSYGTHHHSHHNHHSFHHSRASHGHGPSYYASHPSHANHRRERERERDRNNINNYGASGYASHQNDLIFQSFDASISNILRKIDLLNEKMNKEDSIENIKQLQLCFECLDSIYKLQNRVNGSIYDSPCHATTNGSYYQLPYGPNHGPHYGPPRGPPYHGPRGHHRPGRGRFHGYHQTTPSPHGAGGPLPHDAYGYY